MYKFNYKLTYNKSEDDGVYRSELLHVFNLKNYDNIKIQKTIDEIIKPLISPHFNKIYEFMKKIMKCL